MWEFCSLLFCVADWFVQPAFEREIKTGTTLIPAQTLHVAVQEQLHFQTILSSPRLAWSSEKLFPTRFPGEPGRSSPLPALHHLVQPCSCRVFWREDPALSRERMERGCDLLLKPKPHPEGRCCACAGCNRVQGGEKLNNLCPIRGPFSSLLFIFLPPVAAFSHLLTVCLREGKGYGMFSRKAYHSSQSGLYKLEFKQLKPIGLGCWECSTQQMLP